MTLPQTEQPIRYVPKHSVFLPLADADWTLEAHNGIRYFQINKKAVIKTFGHLDAPQRHLIPAAFNKRASVTGAAFLRITCMLSNECYRLAFAADSSELLAFDNSEIMTYFRSAPAHIVIRTVKTYEKDGEALSISGTHRSIPTDYALVDLVDASNSVIIKRLIGPPLPEIA